VHARAALAELLDRVERHAPPAGLAHVRSLAARDEPREQRRGARLHGPAAIAARAADSAEAELGMAAVPDGYLRAHG
jgi:hypothetical protein